MPGGLGPFATQKWEAADQSKMRSDLHASQDGETKEVHGGRTGQGACWQEDKNGDEPKAAQRVREKGLAVMPQVSIRTVVVASPLAVAAVVCGCSENSGDTVVPTVSSPQAGILPVEARDFSFVPERLSARVGAEIEFQVTNSGSVKHSLSLYEDSEHTQPVRNGNTGEVAAGAQTQLRFQGPEGPSTLYFRCEVHPDQMDGELSIG